MTHATRSGALIAGGAVVLATVFAIGGQTASATQNDKITICHATGSATNPYVKNKVDGSSIDEQNNEDENGHGDHANDIIPPFKRSGPDFPGRNWTSSNREIWEDDCKITVTATAPTSGTPACGVTDTYTIPAQPEIQYQRKLSQGGWQNVAAGTYDLLPGQSVEIRATSDTVKLKGKTSWKFTGDPKTECPVPDPVPVDGPTFVNGDCEADAVVTIPTQDDVTYEAKIGDGNWATVTGPITVPDGQTINIRAISDLELELADPSSWEFTANDPQNCTTGGETPTPPIVVPPVVEVPVVEVPVIEVPVVEVPVVEPTPENPATEVDSAGPTPAPAAPAPAAPATLPSTGAATNGMIAAAFAILLAGLGLRRFARND